MSGGATQKLMHLEAFVDFEREHDADPEPWCHAEELGEVHVAAVTVLDGADVAVLP